MSTVGSSGSIRQCQVCGMFYPGRRGELVSLMTDLLERVPPLTETGRIFGLVMPHAGYEYSGFTAAHGAAALRGRKYRTVVIVSPSHREYFDGVSVYPGRGYGTPLGIVPIDEGLREIILREGSVVRESFRGHGAEHAVEVQLPFLQHVLGDFLVLPMVMGDQRRDRCSELGKILATCLDGKDVLLIASTDLSHYHTSSEARELDKVAIDDIEHFDYVRLMDDLESGKTEACGGGPTVAVMTALRSLGGRSMQVLYHCTSGDVTGDQSSVVGYMAAAATS